MSRNRRLQCLAAASAAAVILLLCVRTRNESAQAQPQLPVGETPASTASSAQLGLDPGEPVRMARDCTTNDATHTSGLAVTYTAKKPNSLTSTVNMMQYSRGAKMAVFAVDCSTADVGETISVWGFKKNANGSSLNGFLLDRWTTQGGSRSTANTDPYGFGPTASTTWYDADTITAGTTSAGNTIGLSSTHDGDGGSDNRTALRTVDLFGCQAFYVNVTGCASAMKTRVYWWPLLGG